MKPANDNSGTYIENDVQHNDKDPKFKVGDHVKISKYMINFEKVTKKKKKKTKKKKTLYHGQMLLVISMVKI